MSSTHQELKSWPVLCAFWIFHKLYGFSSHDLTFLFHFHLNDVCLIFWAWIYLYRFLPLVWSIIVICLEQGELSKLELSEPSGLKVVPIYSVFSLVSIKSQSARSCIAVYPLIASWGLRSSHSFLRTSEISPILYFKKNPELFLDFTFSSSSFPFSCSSLYQTFLERVLYIYYLYFLISHSYHDSFQWRITPETALQTALLMLSLNCQVGIQAEIMSKQSWGSEKKSSGLKILIWDTSICDVMAKITRCLSNIFFSSVSFVQNFNLSWAYCCLKLRPELLALLEVRYKHNWV